MTKVSSSPTVTGSQKSRLAQVALAPGDINPPFNTGTKGTGNVDSDQNFDGGFNLFNIGNNNTTVANNYGAGTNIATLGNSNVSSGTNLEFRLEAFNLLNRSNFRAPNGNVSSAAFGTITSTYDPRQLQLGVKVNW